MAGGFDPNGFWPELFVVSRAPRSSIGSVRLAEDGTGQVALPASDPQSVGSCDTLLDGDAVLLQLPGQPMELKIRTAEALKPACGSVHPQFNAVLLNNVIGAMPLHALKGNEGEVRRAKAAIAAMKAFKPADEIEGMLAAQAVALHSAGMECLRRAMIPDQPAEFASKLRKDGANLLRSMTEMLDALDRKRGKGPQVVRVERVVVHEGGQAVVGNVQAGG